MNIFTLPISLERVTDMFLYRSASRITGRDTGLGRGVHSSSSPPSFVSFSAFIRADSFLPSLRSARYLPPKRTSTSMLSKSLR